MATKCLVKNRWENGEPVKNSARSLNEEESQLFDKINNFSYE